ncbi:iron-sulfur binding hydrogenase [Chitinivibrio alkaliphilus]|uniref:Iron-sulfur binding hydrogenase n=1 Tax=Chitinivibrio alkaliphilus ACht1 TaxID=1313304 RepID=U7D5E8_9BACT|nr:iron-sulfur binding hydrogenase [Chitinivibrio alkaliphilus]ERP31744.1 iron-sulfur binding hydrogenase [Chitinivibrio alkaliphilus ACht1]
MDVRVLETIKELDLVCNTARTAEIHAGYTSDLLSDVMAHAEEDSVLITIQAHKNSVAVASITGIAAIIFCNSRTVDTETIEAAEEAEVALFQTTLNQFQASVLINSYLQGD